MLSDVTWPTTGNEDAGLFNAITLTKSGRDGNIRLTFSNDPDYENPKDTDDDNVHQVRLHNRHGLYNASNESRDPACSGSAVDLSITVKDVGTPAPITPSARFQADDTSKLDISWAAPVGFVEDGSIVAFPHSEFDPSAYDYRYRKAGTTTWTEVFDVTDTNVTVDGLTEAAYQVQVRAKNSEGTTPWPADGDPETITAQTVRKPDRPDKPTATVIAPESITITWTAPADNGNGITGYQVRTRRSSLTDDDWTTSDHDSDVTSATFVDLNENAEYLFEVKATNAGGDSPWSDTLEVSTTGYPYAGVAAGASISEGKYARFTATLSHKATVTVDPSLVLQSRLPLVG